jgi:hypothetical protein
MKITPLFIFFILMFLFLIFILFIRGKKYFNFTEGFIAFEGDKNPLSNILIPLYSKTKPVMKIYDNFYLDQTNLNLIEVNGIAYNQGTTITGNIDDQGTTINNLWVIPPSGQTINIPSDIPNHEPSLAQMPNLLNIQPWSYISQSPSMPSSSNGNYTDTYQIFFMPVPQINTTIAYVAHLTNSKSLLCLKIQSQVEDCYFISDPSFQGLGVAISDTDPNNGGLVNETLYDANQSVFQISTLVKFDYTTQNLLVKSSNGATLSVYDYSKNQTISTSAPTAGTFLTKTSSNAFSAWSVVDENNNLIVYIPINSEYTMILLLQFSGNKLSLGKAITFLKDISTPINVYPTYTPTTPAPTTPAPTTPAPTTPAPTTPTTTPATTPATTTPATTTPATTTSPVPTTSATTLSPSSGGFGNGRNKINTQYQNPISSYYNMQNPNYNTSDYILKTQLIPPVGCPNCICSNCQSSPYSNCCSSCGGSTNGVAINTPSPAPTTPPIPTIPTIGPSTPVLGNAIGRAATGVGNAVGGLATGVGNAVGGLASGVGNVAGGLETGVGNIAGGAGNLVGGVASGVGNIAGGAGNLVGGVASGVGNIAEGAGNLVGGVASGVGNIAGGLVSGVGNLVGGVSSGVGNVVGGVSSGVGNVVGGLSSGVGNVVGGATKNVGLGTDTNFSNSFGIGIGEGGQVISNGIGMSGRSFNNQRNQYYPSQQPSSYLTQYGAQSAQTSTFIPITSDFSKFQK